MKYIWLILALTFFIMGLWLVPILLLSSWVNRY